MINIKILITIGDQHQCLVFTVTYLLIIDQLTFKMTSSLASTINTAAAVVVVIVVDGIVVVVDVVVVVVVDI